MLITTIHSLDRFPVLLLSRFNVLVNSYASSDRNINLSNLLIQARDTSPILVWNLKKSMNQGQILGCRFSVFVLPHDKKHLATVEGCTTLFNF